MWRDSEIPEMEDWEINLDKKESGVCIDIFSLVTGELTFFIALQKTPTLEFLRFCQTTNLTACYGVVTDQQK